MRRALLGLAMLLGLCWAVTYEQDASAANWARFRGPNGTGIADDTDIPVKWTDKNILWHTPIPGAGNSSPIVWGDRIFLQSATPDGKQRMLVCVSATNGKIAWSKTLEGAKATINERNSFASSTPATDGERVYCAFWDGKKLALYGYDFQGTQLWTRDLGAVKSQHGAGNSPVVYGDKVYFLNDHDEGARLICLDGKTGMPVWEKTRPHFRACYSTPFLLDQDGTPQLIVVSTLQITAYDPKTGDTLWSWDWKFPGEKMPLRTVGSPIAANGLLFATSGDGSGSRHMVAVKLGGKGDTSKTGLTWEKKKNTPYVPSLLTHGDQLFFVNDLGLAGCFDAKTGAEVWLERLGGGFQASPVLINGKVYAPSEDGRVYVFEASPTFKVLAKNELGGRLLASPAVADHRLYVRGPKELYCIGKAK
jgi:outer membrane protein assembly factor BamB